MIPLLRSLYSSVLLAFVAVFGAGVARAADIDPVTAARLADKIANGEKVRVILRLKGEAVPLLANQSTRIAVQNAIEARQKNLAARHPGLVKAVKRFRQAPVVALETDALGLNSLLSDPDVASIEEDIPLYLNLTETPAITRADLAWSAGYRGANQAVAILDTGVDSAHPMFAGKIVNEACFSAGGTYSTSLCPNGQAQQTGPGSAAPCSDSSLGCYHGTHVAGIAAGKSGVLANAAGMAPDAKIIAIQVFTRECEPGAPCSLSAYSSDLGLALDHVYQLRNTYSIASVNLSLGGGLYTSVCDSQSQTLKSLIDLLRAANIATVIASGNNGSASSISFPACISSAISVGATTKQNAIASYSNSSSLVSLLAPGSSINSAMPGGGYGYASGTSMATPHVAGVWALMKSAKPSATVSEVLTALQSSGLPITDTRNGIVKPLIQLGGSSGAIASMLGFSNQAPSVSLTSPANNASFTAPATIALTASASDSDGSITKVEFYNGTTLIASDTNGGDGWGISWSAVPQGSYQLSAKAFDNSGASVSSASVSVTVNAASGGANLALGRPASASSQWSDACAAAYANDSSDNASGGCGGWSPSSADAQPWWQVDLGNAYRISTLELVTRQNCCDAPETRQNFEVRASNDPSFASYVVLGTQGATALPFKATWSRAVTDTNGYRYIRATKTGYFFIAELRVFGSAASNQAPSVSLTSPANNASFTAPATIALSANASDSDGSITKVEFYNGTTLIASDTNGGDGWGISWGAVPQGNYQLSAKAFDNSGASVSSASVSVIVGPAGGGDPTLVAHWKFDETTGAVAADASGYANNGTLTSGPAWTGGKQANALAFDGIDDYVLVNHSGSLAIGQNNADFSAAFFLNLRQGTTGLWRSLIHKGAINDERTFGIWAFNTDNRLAYQVSTSAAWVESGTSAAQIPLNQWVHIAFVKSGNAIRLYINGVLDSQRTLNGSVIGNSGPLYIGKDPWHSGADSLMDDVRIYNRALSASEIATLAGI